MTASHILEQHARLRAVQQRMWAAHRDVINEACLWADTHPVPPDLFADLHGEDIVHATLGGDGVPLVDPGAVAEFAALMGKSTSAGRRLLGDALELRHRLPQLWARVQELTVDPGEACRVAYRTRAVSREVAAAVDAELAPQVGRLSSAQIDRRVEMATARAGGIPAAREASFVEFIHDTVSVDGRSYLSAVLPFVDGLELDHAVTHGARLQAFWGSTQSRDVRRAHALAEIARNQLMLPAPDREPVTEELLPPDLPDPLTSYMSLAPRDQDPGAGADQLRGPDGWGESPPSAVDRGGRAVLSEPDRAVPPDSGGDADPLWAHAATPSPRTPPDQSKSLAVRQAQEQRTGTPIRPPAARPIMLTVMMSAAALDRSHTQTGSADPTPAQPLPVRPVPVQPVPVQPVPTQPVSSKPVSSETGGADARQNDRSGIVPPEPVIGRLANVNAPVTAEEIRAWCGVPGATIIVRPIIDLNTAEATPTYAPTPRMNEHVKATNATCVFPWCHAPATRADLDHIVPFDQAGPTSTDNLAPLCRAHHNLKTHHGWRYERQAPQQFVWTSPAHERYLRSGFETSSLTTGIDSSDSAASP